MALPIHSNERKNIGRGFGVSMLVLAVLAQPLLAIDIVDQENPNHGATALRKFKS